MLFFRFVASKPNATDNTTLLYYRMDTPQSISLRLVFNSFHRTFITQRLDAWISAFNRSSPFPNIETPLISTSIDLIQVNIDNISFYLFELLSELEGALRFSGITDLGGDTE